MRAALEGKSPDSCVRFGRLLEDKGEYASAVFLYSMAAARKHREAQFLLGRCYYLGHGVPRSLDKAAEFLETAIIGKPPLEAYLILASILDARGQHDKASRVIDMACPDHATARLMLSQRFYHNFGVPPDVDNEENADRRLEFVCRDPHCTAPASAIASALVELAAGNQVERLQLMGVIAPLGSCLVLSCKQESTASTAACTKTSQLSSHQSPTSPLQSSRLCARVLRTLQNGLHSRCIRSTRNLIRTRSWRWGSWRSTGGLGFLLARHALLLLALLFECLLLLLFFCLRPG